MVIAPAGSQGKRWEWREPGPNLESPCVCNFAFSVYREDAMTQPKRGRQTPEQRWTPYTLVGPLDGQAMCLSGSKEADDWRVSRGQLFLVISRVSCVVTVVLRGLLSHLYTSGNRLRELHLMSGGHCWGWDFNFKVCACPAAPYCPPFMHGLQDGGHDLGWAFSPCHQAPHRLLEHRDLPLTER